MSNKVPNEGLPSYNFETATESERWAYDQGYETGWQARNTELLDSLDSAMQRLVDEMRRTLADMRAQS
ncbi:hypothetical protein JOF29_007910 [Kribbella aluminosa]|uniref:Uncharacterized protein n=1 Tax=Kribbella aluminosa TaxID=416017 RepID=A0ABS4UYT7_9ACTN|nr:hypothetical protein [Kribbella aluminosa]MBP2356800.1 hypothetical protein [Kribbella aluminosa]